MIRDVLEEISAEESDFFTPEGLDALRAVGAAASPNNEKPNGEVAAKSEAENT